MTAPARPTLTARQQEVLGLVAQGFTRQQTATRLGVSKQAVDYRIQEAIRNLGAHTTAHAVLLACQAALLPDRPGPARDLLSDRTLEILRLAAAGHTNAAIGRQVGVSPDTVKWRLQQAYRLLGTDDRAHAVVIAIRLGLIDPTSIPLPGRLRDRLTAREAREAA